MGKWTNKLKKFVKENWLRLLGAYLGFAIMLWLYLFRYFCTAETFNLLWFVVAPWHFIASFVLILGDLVGIVLLVFGLIGGWMSGDYVKRSRKLKKNWHLAIALLVLAIIILFLVSYFMPCFDAFGMGAESWASLALMSVYGDYNSWYEEKVVLIEGAVIYRDYAYSDCHEENGVCVGECGEGFGIFAPNRVCERDAASGLCLCSCPPIEPPAEPPAVDKCYWSVVDEGFCQVSKLTGLWCCGTCVAADQACSIEWIVNDEVCVCGAV